MKFRFESQRLSGGEPYASHRSLPSLEKHSRPNNGAAIRKNLPIDIWCLQSGTSQH